jgi:SAM-dependent methyltransferase
VTDFRPFVDASGRYYTDKFLRHGADAAGVDWRDSESQHLRFRQLLRLADDGAPFSINDYGCGYGALASWLEDERRPARYVGFDVSRPMIEHARAAFAGRDDVAFVESADELPVADYTVASGVFNVKLDAPLETWTEYVLDTIREMRGRSRVGLAFNMLTSYSDPERMRPDLYYAEPAFFFDFCKRELSRQIALLHDYGLWEFTVIVRLEHDR